MTGEGMVSAAASIAVVGLAGYLFVRGAAKLGEGWTQAITAWPSDELAVEEARAGALVPEYAAALRAPDYSGRCRCVACRARPKEPCSDFDGD